MKNIAIDFVPHSPGKGGAGGGIWTVAKNLILELDKIDSKTNQINIICFVNSDLIIETKNLKLVTINFKLNSIFKRFFYIHFMLPFLCLFYKIDILQKLASEVPFFTFCKVNVMVHDFMTEFYVANDNFHIKQTLLEKIKQFYFLNITKLAIIKSNFIITPSKTIATELLNRYQFVKEDKVFTFYNGVNLTTQVIDFNNRNRDNIINFYCIAGFFPHKGHLRTIAIFEKLRSKGLDIELYFRGSINDLNYFDIVKNRIEKSPFKSHIHILKFEKNECLFDIYKSVDLLILLSDYEGFGLPIIEAQSLNIPVICSDIPVFREVAGSGALFLNNLDLDSSVFEILKFLDNKSFIEYTKNAGLENSKQFRWDFFAQKIYNLYL